MNNGMNLEDFPTNSYENYKIQSLQDIDHQDKEKKPDI